MHRAGRAVVGYGGGSWRGGWQGQVMGADVVEGKRTWALQQEKKGNWSNECDEILRESSR